MQDVYTINIKKMMVPIICSW